jgi:hypothetical protein
MRNQSYKLGKTSRSSFRMLKLLHPANFFDVNTVTHHKENACAEQTCANTVFLKVHAGMLT